MTSFEDVIAEAGDLGPYQKKLIVLLVVVTMPVSFNTNLPVLIMTVPHHRCALDNYPNDSYAIQNDYHRRLINETIPWTDDDQSVRSSCTILRQTVPAKRDLSNNSNSNGHVSEFNCEHYVFDKEYFDRTIIEELNIVCDQEEWRTHANMAMMMGKMTSALIQGVTSDIFGRRKTLLGFVVLMVLSIFANALIYNIPSLIAIRFLCGLATTSTYTNCFIIAMEFLGVRHRLAFNIIFGVIGYNGSAFLMTGLAYAIRDYAYLCVALGGPTLLSLSAFWLIPESPRWLISRGRYQEAEQIIQNLSKVNGKKFPEQAFHAMIKDVEEEQQEKRKALEDRKSEGRRGKKADNILSVFQHPILIVRFLILVVNWIANSLTYYGLLLNVQNLSGDIYLNFFLINCVDIAGNFVSYFTVDRFGRKWNYIAFLGLAMLACLASIFPPLYATKGESDTAMTALSMIGRLGISTSFNIIYLFSAEIFPTTIRNTAMGFSQMAAKAGSVSAPYIADMGMRIGGDLKTALPLIVIGACTFVSWIGALILPETSKHAMPETIMDAVNYGRKIAASKGSTETNGDAVLEKAHDTPPQDSNYQETNK